jgi:hypothetical protein
MQMNKTGQLRWIDIGSPEATGQNRFYLHNLANCLTEQIGHPGDQFINHPGHVAQVVADGKRPEVSRSTTLPDLPPPMHCPAI